MSPHIRTVTTASGVTAVQIVHSNKRGSRNIGHIGSAHTDAELAALKAEAAQRLQGDELADDVSGGSVDMVPVHSAGFSVSFVPTKN